MRFSMRRVSLVLLGFLLGAAVFVAAEAVKPATPAAAAPSKLMKDFGLIFNVAFPLDLQAYQAGFGMKFGRDDLHLRSLLDLVASGVSDSFAVKIGATAEYHLTPEPVSLYVGGSGSGGYMIQSGSFSSFVFSLGALVGVEYYPLKFLSLFAEYALAADFTWTTDLATSQTTFDYLVDTRMGNDSKIGIVIHILRLMGK